MHEVFEITEILHIFPELEQQILKENMVTDLKEIMNTVIPVMETGGYTFIQLLWSPIDPWNQQMKLLWIFKC